MAHGRFLVNMSVIKHLGIDAEDIRWWHIAACKDMPIEWFYDKYESDKELAKQIDQICLNCPVIKFCHDEGISEKAYAGVWGGVYMKIGKPDKKHNLHKTPEVWKRLKKLHG